MKALSVGLLFLCVFVSAVSGAEDDSGFDEKLDFANGLYARNMYGMAIDEYDALIKQFPNHPNIPQAIFRSSESHFLSNRYEEALKRYQGFVASYPDREETVIARGRIGEAMYYLGASHEALDYFKDLYNSPHKPTRFLARYYSGKICFDKQSFKAARIHFKHLVNHEDGNTYYPFAHFYMGEIGLKEHEYAAALSHFRLAIDSGHSEVIPAAQFGMGRALFFMGKFEEAKLMFYELSLDPKNKDLAEDGFLNYMDTLYRLNAYAELVKAYQDHENRFLDPQRRVAARFIAALSFTRLSRHADAFAIYDLILSDEAGSRDIKEKASLSKIQVMIDMEAFDRALEAVEAFQAAQPNAMDEVYFLKANILRHFGRSKDATRALRALIQNYPESPYLDRAYLNQGYLHLEIGSFKDARDVFKTFLAKFPDHAQNEKILSDLALLDVKLEDYAQAIEDTRLFLKLHAESPDAPKAHLRLAALYTETKEYGKALQTYQTHLATYNPGEEVKNEIYFLSGYNQQLSGDLKAAVDAYSRVAKGAAANDILYSMLKNRAYCHIRLEAMDLAAADYNEIVQSFPENDLKPEVFFWLAHYFLERSDSDGMRRLAGYLESRSDVEERRSDVEYFAGESNRLDGKCDEAIARYEVSIAKDGPFAADAYLGKGICEGKKGLTENAHASFKDALKKAGQNHALAIRIRLDESELYNTQAKYAEAAKGYLAIAILYDDPKVVPEALWKAGQAFKKSGDNPKAVQVYNELLERFADHALADQVKDELEKLDS